MKREKVSFEKDHESYWNICIDLTFSSGRCFTIYIYIYTRQRVIKRSYVIDCANKHLSDWELQLVSERDEITNAGYRDSNFSKMHRQKKFYVNIYIYRTYLFILKKNRTIFTDFRIKNKSSILNDSMRNEYRYRSSLPECYFEGVKGP